MARGKRAMVRSIFVVLAVAACGGGASEPATPPSTPAIGSIELRAGGAQSAQVGVDVTTPPSVTVKDVDGNPVSGVTVQFSALHATSTVSPATTTTDAVGVAAATQWTLGYSAGIDSIEIKIPQVQYTIAGNPTYLVAHALPGPAQRLRAVSDTLQTSGNSLPAAITPSIQVTDSYGNGVAGVSVHFAADSGSGSVNGADQTTDSTGAATVGRWTLGPAIGVQRLVVHAVGNTAVTDSAVFHVTTIYSTSQMTLASGDSQVVPTLIESVAPFAVRVAKTDGSPIAGVAVTFTTTVPTDQLDNRGVHTETIPTDANGVAGAHLDVEPGSDTHGLTASAPGYRDVVFHPVGPALLGTSECLLTTVGHAFCWGENNSGQLGNGSTSGSTLPTAVGGGIVFSSVASGYAEHACGVATDGRGYCWGSNVAGELGDGTTTMRTEPTLVSGGITWAQLAVGRTGTCGVSTAGDLYCWGWSGHAGLGGAVNGLPVTTPQELSAGGVHFTQVAVGIDEGCALGSDQKAYCWGWNYSGKLGIARSDVAATLTPTMTADDRSYATLAVGASMACGIGLDQYAYCWGYGDLGDGAGVFDYDSPTLAANSQRMLSVSLNTIACGAAVDHRWLCWGDLSGNGFGALARSGSRLPVEVPGGLQISSVQVYDYFACAITVSKQPFCVGQNGVGQLGDGTDASGSWSPTPVHWVEGTAGVAVGIIATSAITQSAAAGTAVAGTPTVEVVDFAGNPVAGATVTFTVTNGGGSITNPTTTTNQSGVATAGNWILGATAGDNVLVASVSGIGQVTFDATGK